MAAAQTPTKRVRAEAAAILRRVLERVDGGHLAAPPATARRLEGAATALEATAPPARSRTVKT